jgi:hypothetical protein
MTTMLKVLAAVLLAMISGAVGDSLPRPAATEYKYVTPYDEHKDRTPVANGTSLGCKALAETYLNANTIPNAHVKARAAPGTDTVAMTLADDGKTISFLTGNAMRGGATEGRPIPVVDKNQNYIVAANYAWPSFDVIILEISSGNAVWSSTGLFLGMQPKRCSFNATEWALRHFKPPASLPAPSEPGRADVLPW